MHTVRSAPKGSPSIAARLFEVPGGSRQSAPLQGLRGFAVILVFFVHYDSLFSQYIGNPGIALPLSHFLGRVGHAGVDLFFVLSGLLIYRAVLRPFGYWSFLRRRARRLYPCFLAVLAVYVALALIQPSLAKLPDTAFARALFLVENIALLPGIVPINPLITVAWSLSYEMCFYILLPLAAIVLGLGQREARSRILGIASVGIVGLIVTGLVHVQQERMLMFLAGMLAFELCAFVSDRFSIGRRYELAVLIATAAAFPAIAWLTPYDAIPWGARAMTILFVVFGALVLCASAADGLVAGIFAFTPLCWLGNISYSFYLVHGLALHATLKAVALAKLPLASAFGFAVLLPLCWCAAVILATTVFVSVERPFSFTYATRSTAVAERRESSVAASV